MALALLVLYTVPVRISVRNTSSPLHISYTLFIMWGYKRFALSHPSDGRSVGTSSVAGIRTARTSICNFFERCGNAVRTPLWCDMGFKYITMSEIYAVHCISIMEYYIIILYLRII